MPEVAKCPKCGNQLDWCMFCHVCHPELAHVDPDDIVSTLGAVMRAGEDF